MNERAIWIACAAAGLTTLLMAMIVLPLFPADAATDVSDYSGPV